MTSSAALAFVLAGATLSSGPALAAKTPQPSKSALGHYKNVVVIYDENHSFDNLYGGWGKVGDQTVEGKYSPGYANNAPQVDQNGNPISCLPQNDANLVTNQTTVTWLDGTKHPGALPVNCTGTDAKGNAFTSAFTSSAPYSVNDYIAARDKTCPPKTSSAPVGVQKGDPQGLPGGCTRDLVHRFYQEQYQLGGGKMNRYVTGSDALGLTQGVYDTRSLALWQYLHRKGAPNYVVADNFFQAAFGGSFMNHQYLIAAQTPQWDTSQKPVPAGKNSVLDAAGFPNGSYAMYKPDPNVAYNDGPLTQACDQPSTVTGFACGNYAVNTMQPSWVPSAGGSNVLPGVNDVDPSKPFYQSTIGDELSKKGVSWAWYSGGWDDANAGKPDPLFQYHHQPFNYFQAYAPGQPGRAHLQDETRFFAAAKNGTLPAVSFVKPLGAENEHPGYASVAHGQEHLVDLVKAVMNGPQAGNTLVVITYDEFGGQWDHVTPPGQGDNAPDSPSDVFGPGTRIPAFLISRSLPSDAVDSTPYDTTSILRTLEKAYGLPTLDRRFGRDANANDLSHALRAAGVKTR